MDPLADGRYEIKRLAAATELPSVLAWLRLHNAGFREAYPPRWVNNVYFDTEELSSVRDNLAGFGRRVKMRLRWYGRTWSVERGVLEFKCKQDSLGWKISHRIEETVDLAAVAWREVTSWMERRLPAAARQTACVARRPVLVNRYRRLYHVSADGLVRATVDTDVSVYSQWAGTRPNLSRAVPGQHRIVLELKASADAYDRLAAVSSAMPGYVCKHSKYLAGIYGVFA